MDVNVGHASDPADLPGLAHFLEHMLFLGTEKYPEEGHYNQFLQERGGSSNAYTDFEHTNFFFDVLHPHLEQVATPSWLVAARCYTSSDCNPCQRAKSPQQDARSA